MDQFSRRLAFQSDAEKSNNPLICARARAAARRGRLCCVAK